MSSYINQTKNTDLHYKGTLMKSPTHPDAFRSGLRCPEARGAGTGESIFDDACINISAVVRSLLVIARLSAFPKQLEAAPPRSPEGPGGHCSCVGNTSTVARPWKHEAYSTHKLFH